MFWGNKAAKQQIKDTICSSKEKIEVLGGECRLNFRCHYNAVHEAIKKGDEKLAMVVYIDDDYPIIHFINYHNGEFVDNTLGEWVTRFDVYFIKWVHKDEFWGVNKIFGSYRKELRKSLRWVTRLSSSIEN